MFDYHEIGWAKGMLHHVKLYNHEKWRDEQSKGPVSDD